MSLFRIDAVVDYTSFVSDAVNPNLRGLGHTGWGRSGNPTHCIRVALLAESEQPKLTYKLHESDTEWRPKTEYDSTSKQWEVCSNAYEVITFSETARLLSSSPKILEPTRIPENIKRSVLECATKFPGTINLHSNMSNLT